MANPADFLVAERDVMVPRIGRVRDRRCDGPEIWTLDIEDGNPAPPFVPGQFNMLMAFGLGEVPISQPRHNVEGVSASSQRWVYRKDDSMTNYLMVNTPVNVQPDLQCGKFVFGDMHLYGGDVQPAATALPDDAFPGSCSKELTPEEKALVFLFFDLASCVQDDKIDPQAPIR